MKKLFIFAVTVSIAVTTLNSCNKEIESASEANQDSTSIFTQKISEELIVEMLQQINSNPNSKAGDGWLRRAWDWVKDHTGASVFYVQGVEINMELGLPCGPNPGFCLRSGQFDGTVTGEAITSPEDLALGFSTFGLWLIENQSTSEETIMLVFNKDVNNYLYEGKLRIDDAELSSALLTVIDRSYAKIQGGVYPVVYDSETGFHYTVVNSTITK